MSLQFTWMLAFIVIGAGWYVIDRSVGAGFYRWWYGMTHRDPLPPEVERGFIYNQPAKIRFTAAVLIAMFQSIVSVQEGHSDFSVELLSVFLEVPVIMLGFFIGPKVYSWWGARDNLFQKVDKIEQGEIDLGKKLKEASGRAADYVHTAIDDLRGGDKEAPRLEDGPGASSVPPADPVVEPDQEVDPRSFMDKYLRR